MRLHRAESAFFVFIALVFGAGILLSLAYGIVRSHRLQHDAISEVSELNGFTNLLLTTGVLLSSAVLFGLFFIYPLIRRQVRKEVELRAMTETLSARSELLQHAALTDSLTGTQNRRFFDNALREYLTAFADIGKPVGLMVLDLDDFKRVNDLHGHDVGDTVLREVGQCLRSQTRDHDVVARLGGEEFAVIAPNMHADGLVNLAERIREAICILPLESDNVRLRITISIGLAIWDGAETADGFYRRADKMLYHAKRLGRNRVCA